MPDSGGHRRQRPCAQGRTCAKQEQAQGAAPGQIQNSNTCGLLIAVDTISAAARVMGRPQLRGVHASWISSHAMLCYAAYLTAPVACVGERGGRSPVSGKPPPRPARGAIITLWYAIGTRLQTGFCVAAAVVGRVGRLTPGYSPSGAAKPP